MESKFYSIDQQWSVVESLLERFEKEQTGGGYSYTTSTQDKRYKSGRRETSHWVSPKYRERTSSERRAFIKQLIKEIDTNESFTILQGYGYLMFFIYMRYPFLRNKAQRTIKRRVLKNYGDLPSYREQLKEFKNYYCVCECLGWLGRLLFFFGFDKEGLGPYYKRINSL